jgi:hypothetical protein
MGQTRRRKVGGALLGEGVQGKTYDMGCNTEGDSMCTMLETNKVSEIRLELEDGSFTVLNSKEDIHEFVEFLHTVTGKIAKVFKPVGIFSMKTLQNKLDEEIEFNKSINKIYGRAAKRYVTSDPVKGFRKLSIVGAIVTVNGQRLLFVVFGTKCTNVYDIDLDKFIIDILSSLVKLENGGYLHNDIKLDNIVRCSERYKLIDWGKLGSEKERGNSMFTSPAKWYINGYSQIVSRNAIRLSKNKEVINNPLFKENNKRVVAEFDQLVHDHTRSEISELLKNTHDVFMFGNTILQAVMLHNFNYEKYKPIIDALTSLKEPLTAIEALRLSKKILKNES